MEQQAGAWDAPAWAINQDEAVTVQVCFVLCHMVGDLPVVH